MGFRLRNDIKVPKRTFHKESHEKQSVRRGIKEVLKLEESAAIHFKRDNYNHSAWTCPLQAP